MRKSTSDSFEHEVTRDEGGLLVRFDAAPWLAGIEYGALVQTEGCAPGRAAVRCAGTVEETCDATGAALSTRDCAEDGNVCVPDEGCADHVALEPTDAAYRAIRNAVVSGQRPAFEWGFSP